MSPKTTPTEPRTRIEKLPLEGAPWAASTAKAEGDETGPFET
jgi:hypothetical protein